MKYTQLIKNISQILDQGRQRAYVAVNDVLVQTYWQIGREVVVYEQKGHLRAEYGDDLLNKIAKDLKQSQSKGFSRSNVYLMRQFYLKYPKIQTLPGKLSKKEEMAGDDKEPIGIILAADKDDVLVEYALGGISSKLFVSKYQVHLPDKKQLRFELRKMI